MSTRNRPCRRPGCRALTKHKSGFCLKHYRPLNKRYDREQRDPDAVKFYQSSQWKKIRRSKLLANPLCERCLAGDREVVTAANTVHHRDGNINNNEASNLESLCAACHNRIKNHRWGWLESSHISETQTTQRSGLCTRGVNFPILCQRRDYEN